MVEFPQLQIRQAHLSADVEANPCGTHAMADGLTFRQIEGVAQSAKDFRQLYGPGLRCTARDNFH
ncbi:hypothetical protein GCM10007890_28120 [Methylobacterium tardum]|uniref:Uncharacterized protein n=1 Tax=Methylobacterium tardum TaxID=374432 RepID=A0AA37TCE6_9HYPH|nr:hypothetical protein GCM10007890_28120 [Methylobacterium tardum]